MRTLLLTLCLLLTTGATYYVSPTGNDSTGTGAIGAPWKTILYSIGRMSGGDTLYLRGGTYAEAAIPKGAFDGKSGPAPETPTRFVGYTGETALFKPPGGAALCGIDVGDRRSNFWFEGFTIDCDNLDIQASIAKKYTHGIGFLGSRNMTITNMVIANVHRGNAFRAFDHEGVYSDNLQILNNTFTNWGSSTLLVGAVYDETQWAVYIKEANNVTVRGNVAYGPALDAGWVTRPGGFGTSRGINLTNELNYISSPGWLYSVRFATNSTLRNNGGICTNPDAYGVYVSDPHNVIVANNTFIGVSGGLPASSDGIKRLGIQMASVTNAHHIYFYNNIIWNWAMAVEIVSNVSAPNYWTNNIIGGGEIVFNTTARGSVGTATTITLDPLLTDATNNTPEGLNFAENSPARNAGVDLSSLFAVDYYGTVRPQEGFFDIGFYEWTSGGQLPTVSVVADGTGYAHELGLIPQTFTFTRTESTSGNLTVNYTISGTATAALHYTAFSDSVVIADGNATVTATVTPLAVAGYQGDKTVIVTLDADAAYTLKSPSTATITIAEADPPPQRILRTQPSPGQTSLRGLRL